MKSLRKKDTSIPMDKFFNLIKPNYKYLKITPDKSIRNYNSANIAKAIKNTYKTILRHIRMEQKKLWVETSFKVSYLVDIKGGNASFYFLVPEVFLPILQEKIREVWSKATLTIEDHIEEHSKKAECYQITYKKEDALSINVDRKNNEPLNSILSVMDIMKDDDRVTIIYNFMCNGYNEG
ncbi:lipid A export ATP-binding/permease [Clostridium phage phiCp-D]|nr:lipid A export ATP-binding/permease [Clostridium phage phiCp-D]